MRVMPVRLYGALYYLLYFGAAGSLLPYLNLYYQNNGISKGKIGVLAALLPLANLIAAPAWAAAADSLNQHQRLLPLAMILTLVPIAFIGTTQAFAPLVVIVFLFAVCLAPVIPLSDHAILTALGDQRHEYGKLRLWGAVGWGSGAWVSGELIEPLGHSVSFGLYAGLMFACFLIALQFPAAPNLPMKREPYWRSLRQLVSQRRWLGFIVSIFLFGLGLAVLNNYLVLYLTSIGGDEGLFGLSLALASLSELPIFFLAPYIIRRWSAVRLIHVAFVVLVIRFVIYAAAGSPWLIVATQVLHGASFSAMWVAGVSHSSTLAPVGLGASAQSLFAAMLYGLSGVLGALVGSHIYATVGAPTLFLITSATIFVGFVVFMMTERMTRTT